MADDERRHGRIGDYRAARIGAAAALIAVACVMLLLDPFVPDYDVDPVVIFGLLGTAAALLGVEGLDVLRDLRR